MFLVFFYLSFSSVRLPSIHKLVDSELYYDLAARSLVKVICLGERKKTAADTLAKQSVHSYLVPFGCGRSFHIFDLFIVGKLRVNRLPQFLYKPLAHLLWLKHKKIIIFCIFNLLICFFAVFSHCFLPWYKSVKNKKCADRNQRTKTQIPVVAKQTIIQSWYIHTITVRNLHFIKFNSNSINKKGINIPNRKVRT